MISTNEFKTGITIEYDGNIYQVIEFIHVKPGKGAAFIRTKLRNLRTSAVIDYTFNAGEKMPKAQIDKVPMQYLYSDDNGYHFMNNETFEQIEIPVAQIKDLKGFIYESMIVQINFFNNHEILGITLPEKISLTVIDTPPGVKGDTKTNAMKDAIMETGLLVKVPLFIENGDKIVISTSDGSYVQRDNT